VAEEPVGEGVGRNWRYWARVPSRTGTFKSMLEPPELTLTEAIPPGMPPAFCSGRAPLEVPSISSPLGGTVTSTESEPWVENVTEVGDDELLKRLPTSWPGESGLRERVLSPPPETITRSSTLMGPTLPWTPGTAAAIEVVSWGLVKEQPVRTSVLATVAPKTR
jgi:hypothetical protein